MKMNDIASALRRKSESQGFVTAKEVADTFGCADVRKIKNKYLTGLEAVNGKYYLISDVARVIQSQVRAS